MLRLRPEGLGINVVGWRRSGLQGSLAEVDVWLAEGIWQVDIWLAEVGIWLAAVEVHIWLAEVHIWLAEVHIWLAVEVNVWAAASTAGATVTVAVEVDARTRAAIQTWETHGARLGTRGQASNKQN
eukprot:15251720-Alexandrium_andersonii.AAC.1